METSYWREVRGVNGIDSENNENTVCVKGKLDKSSTNCGQVEVVNIASSLWFGHLERIGWNGMMRRICIQE